MLSPHWTRFYHRSTTLWVCPVFGGRLTVLYLDTATNQIRGGDILLDPALIDPTPGSRNIKLRAVLMHEIGHFLGLAHSGVMCAAMHPRTIDRPDWVMLDGDDQAALSALYATAANANFGRIKGKLTLKDKGTPVYGAQVVAVNLDTGLTYGTLSKGVNQGAAAGTYELAGLPCGPYHLYAEPIDGPLSQRDWTGNYAAGDYWGGMFTKGYLTTRYSADDSPVWLTGSSWPTINNLNFKLAEEPAAPTTPRLNLTSVALGDQQAPGTPPAYASAKAMAAPVPVYGNRTLYLFGAPGTSFGGAQVTLFGSYYRTPSLELTTSQVGTGSIPLSGTTSVPFVKVRVDTPLPARLDHYARLPLGSRTIRVRVGTQDIYYTGGMLLLLDRNAVRSNWGRYQ